MLHAFVTGWLVTTVVLAALLVLVVVAQTVISVVRRRVSGASQPSLRVLVDDVPARQELLSA